jgi:hypothetical protein
MQCNEFVRFSERWVEGERLPAAAAHLNGCVRCQQFIREMEAITVAALQLAEETPEPSERVWTALRARLEAEGMIRQRGLADWLADAFAILPRPALAGAYAAVLLAAVLLGGLTIIPTQEPPALARAQADVQSLKPQFGLGEPGRVARLLHHDPAVIAKYRESLQTVDNFIAVCEKTVREDPRNPMAREYLYSAYQQKADLLAMMTERGAGGEE